MDLTNKKVTVVGLGLHGGAVGTIEWLISQGANITVTDLKSESDLASTLEKLKHLAGITYTLGRHQDEDFTNADLIVRNPAVPRTSPYLEKARKANVPIEMDSSLFFKHSPTQNIIGITGSKGKTSTTQAIAAVLQRGEKEVIVVGVDGVSPLGNIHRVQADSIVVFELSSWRLEALDEHGLSPKTAVVTTIYPDHLNTYASMDEYVSVKQAIYRHQKSDGVVILNNTDPTISSWSLPEKQVYWYGNLSDKAQFGVFLNEHSIVYKNGDVQETLGNISDLGTWPSHMYTNFLAAILVGRRNNISTDDILEALATQPHLKHRLELVGSKDGVDFINDSAATMPDATIAALSHMQTLGKPVVLILGGGDKKVPYDKLAQKLSETHLAGLVWLPGTATDTMKALTQEKVSTIPSVDASSMPEAVKKAAEIAQSGQTVLLSPGATSFGLFLHEFDRGDQFRQAVMELL